MSNDQPRWGEEPAHDDEPPRYGERIVPTPTSAPASGDESGTGEAPTRAYDAPPVHGPGSYQGSDAPTTAYDRPQYGEHQYGEHQYGEHRSNGRPQYGEPASDSRTGQQDPFAWSQPQPYDRAPAAPAWEDGRAARKPRTVGVVAFVIALLALVAAVVVGITFGNVFGHVPLFKQLVESGSSSLSEAQQSEAAQQFSDELANNASLRTQFSIGGILAFVGTVLGLWAIIQGIVAAATRRGRALGVIALILAIIAPIVLVFVLGGTLAASI